MVKLSEARGLWTHTFSSSPPIATEFHILARDRDRAK